MLPWGLKSVRIAIGMGPYDEIDWGVMERFMFNMETVIDARNSTQLADYIKGFYCCCNCVFTTNTAR